MINLIPADPVTQNLLVDVLARMVKHDMMLAQQRLKAQTSALVRGLRQSKADWLEFGDAYCEAWWYEYEAA